MRSPGSLLSKATRWSVAHPFAVDVAFAAVVGLMSMIGYLNASVEGSERPQDVLGALVIVGQAAAFVFRRRSALASLVGVTAFTVVFWVADYPTNVGVFSMLAVYAATAHGGADRRRVWWVTGTIVALLTAIALLGTLSPSEDLPAVAVVGIAALHLTAAVIGEVVHDRRRRMALLEERAARAEAERELLAREAVLAERSRIARDLHDIVAHAMSMIVVQAGAAERVVVTRPDRAAQSLADISATGREALDEMRRMLGVLRDGEKMELAPQPTLDDLTGVVQHCREAGVPTDLRIDGDRPPRSAGVEMAGYRVVQEALTNVIKHAGRPASAAVRVEYRPDRIHLEVLDDGRGATTDELATATGHGLVGMRERVEMYRGTFHAGPRPGGGFRVAATLPVAAGPDGAADAAPGPVRERSAHEPAPEHA